MRIPLAVWMLLGLACLVGMIAGWVSGSRGTRVRLLNKPTKMLPSVIVSPGPAPRLVPGDSPHAARTHSHHDTTARTPGVAHSGVIHYIAAFTGSVEARKVVR